MIIRPVEVINKCSKTRIQLIDHVTATQAFPVKGSIMASQIMHYGLAGWQFYL